ncbi:MAG: hypothetical protein AB8F78_19860 [Saprospiraceae bacterium]
MTPSFKLTFYLLWTLVVLTFTHTLLAQHVYDVQINQDYDTLTTYTSLSKLAIADGQGPYSFELDVSLDFDFPFFDTILKSLIITTEGEYYPEDSDQTILMFNGSFITDLRIDYAEPWLSSDIRLGRSEGSRGKAIHIEYHNVFSEDEVLLSNNYENKFNFTHSLFEDGTMLVHFGDSNLDGIEYFVNNLGWVSDLNFPEAEGPFFGIEGDENRNETFFVYGTLANLSTTTNSIDSFGVIVNYPPEGTILRISRDSSSSTNEILSNLNELDFLVERNDDENTVSCLKCMTHPTVSLHTISGSLIINSNNNKVNLDAQPR